MNDAQIVVRDAAEAVVRSPAWALRVALVAVLVAACVAGGAAVVGAVPAALDAGDDPCVLLTAGEVQAAVGVADPDGQGSTIDSSVVNRCVYGDANGLHFRISNGTTGDGGQAAKEACKGAKAGNPGFADYARVKGIGKYACAYTLGALGRTSPTLVVVALYRGSKSVGRILTLAVSGTPEQLAPVDAQIDSGLRTLAEQAADAVKHEHDR